MASTDPTAIIILSEIVLFETISLIGIAVFLFMKKKKAIKLLKDKLEAFNKNIPERESSLKSTYSQIPQIKEENLDPIVSTIYEHESQLYKEIVDAFSKNDLSFMSELDNKIFTLAKSYTQVILENSSAAGGKEEEESTIPDVDTAIDELLSEDSEDSAGDPALDLSESIEAESPEEESEEESEKLEELEDLEEFEEPGEPESEMDEIPSELLSENTAETKEDPENNSDSSEEPPIDKNKTDEPEKNN